MRYFWDQSDDLKDEHYLWFSCLPPYCPGREEGSLPFRRLYKFANIKLKFKIRQKNAHQCHQNKQLEHFIQMISLKIILNTLQHWSESDPSIFGLGTHLSKPLLKIGLCEIFLRSWSQLFKPLPKIGLLEIFLRLRSQLYKQILKIGHSEMILRLRSQLFNTLKTISLIRIV